MEEFGVVGLSEVDEFEGEAAVGHDVGGLEVEVGDAVLLEVAEGLRDHKEEIDLGVEGEGVGVALNVLAEVGVADVVDEQVVLVGVVLLGEQVVLGQEHGDAELDAREDEPLVGHSALAAEARQLLVLPLDDDVLLEGRDLPVHHLLHQPHAARPHVPVLDLGEVDGGEPPHLDPLYHRLRQLLVHLYVVQHEEVLVPVARLLVHRQLLAHRQLQPLTDVGALQEAQLQLLPLEGLLQPPQVRLAEQHQAGEGGVEREAAALEPLEGLRLLAEVEVEVLLLVGSF